jgi:hypothetical protein
MTLLMRVHGIECEHYDKALVRIHFGGEETGSDARTSGCSALPRLTTRSSSGSSTATLVSPSSSAPCGTRTPAARSTVPEPDPVTSPALARGGCSIVT